MSHTLSSTNTVCAVKQGPNNTTSKLLIKCFNCNRIGHLARNCWSRPSTSGLNKNDKKFNDQTKTRSGIKCENCGMFGHYTNSCRRNNRDWSAISSKKRRTSTMIRQVTNEGEINETDTDEVC